MALIEALFGDRAGILRTRQFQLLLFANVNGALGLVLVSPFLEVLTGPFAVSDVRIGLLMTAYTVPPVVGIPLVGMLADRYGRKPLLVAGLLVFGLAGAAVSMTTDFTVALVLRILQGIGYAGTVPVIIAAIGDLYTGPTEATAQGLRFTSSGLTHTVFPVIAGILVGFAWQYPFLLYLLAVPIAIAIALFFEETRTSTDTETTVSDGGSTRSRGAYVRQIAALSAQPKMAAILVALAVPSFLHVGFITYVSFLVVRVLGGTPGIAGLLLSVVSVIYAIAASQAGRLTDWLGSRAIPLLAANVCIGVGLSTVALAPALPVAVIGVAIMGLGVGLDFSLLRSVLTSIAPESHRGGIVGLGESLIRLFNSAAPVVIGWLFAVLTAPLGEATAIRYGLTIVAVIGAAIGIGAILVARASPAPGPVAT
ncbi:MAG: MFS transporter [Salinirussus sp.]